MSAPQNQIKVKNEWQELSEDDRNDINKFDKYLSELLSQESVSNLQYDLIIEYILGRAYLAKFITGKLKINSSSKAKNKDRILYLINKLILEKESDKKRVIVQQLDDTLCQIFVNIFEEYKNDAQKIKKFKMLRLGWVKKVSDNTIFKMGEEIGNNHFIDIDQGLSEEQVDQLKRFYLKNNIDFNIYLKKAMDEIEQKKSQQPNTSQQSSQSAQEKLSQEKKKKKPVVPQKTPSSQQPQQKLEKPVQQPQQQQSQQQITPINQEEKKKLQQQKIRKNSNNLNQDQKSSIPQQQSQQQIQQQQVRSQNEISQNNLTNLSSLLNTQSNSSQSNTTKKEDNDGDIQIKKKPKKPIQQSVYDKIHQSPSTQQKPATTQVQHQKPSFDGVNGNTPQKKVKTVTQTTGSSSQKNDPNVYNPASVRIQNQAGQQQDLQNQQQLNQASKPNRLPENIQKERVKKLNEESKNLKTPTGQMLIPSMSLGYGLGSQSEAQITQQTTSQQPQNKFNSSQGQNQISINQDNNQPYIPSNHSLLNNILAPLPPPPQPNLPSSLQQNQQFIQKGQQQIEIKQQQVPPPSQIILQQNQHSLSSSQNQFGSNQDFNQNLSLQKQGNKPLMSNQGLAPIPPTGNFNNNMPDPIQNQPNLNQNIGLSTNIQRNQELNPQNSQPQQNQPIFMNQRITGSGTLDNQNFNVNLRKIHPSGPSLPFQQPPPPPPTPLGQLLDNQSIFQGNMEIENSINNPRRQLPPFNQMNQHQLQPPPLPVSHIQQNIQNINGNRTPQGSSQNLNSSGNIEQAPQAPHIIPPYQQPPPPPTQIAPQRQISQNGYNLPGIQQDKASLFFELFNYIKPTLNTKYQFISEIEKMKQNKITSIQPQLFLSRNEQVIMSSKNIIYDSLPYQCGQCGIRNATREDLRSHLEDHTIKNLKIIESKREKEKEKKNRQLFYDANQWIDCQDEDIEQEQESESETEKNYYVPQNKSNGKCDLCQEPFILTWSEENEDWVYENAKRFEIFETSTGKCQIAIVHLTCYKVLEKQSEIENQVSEDQFESTEKLLS